MTTQTNKTNITIDLLNEHKTLLQYNALKILDPQKCSNTEKLQLETISLMSYMIDYLQTLSQTVTSLQNEHQSQQQVLNFTFDNLPKDESEIEIPEQNYEDVIKVIKQIEAEELKHLEEENQINQQNTIDIQQKQNNEKDDKTSKIEMIETKELKPYYHHLQEWCGKTHSRIIYEGTISDAEEYWNITKNLSNVMIVIQTSDDYFFGSYHSNLPSKQDEWIKMDQHHFVFTLSNPHELKPQKFVPLKNNYQLYYVYNDNEKENILWVNYCYWITCDNIVYVWHHFPDYFNDTYGLGGKLFLGDVDWDNPYEIKKIYLLEWFD